MFIVKYKDGSEVAGDRIVWDDVVATDENHITALHLTLPFKAQQANPDGTFTVLPARTINLGGYNRWYYAKEAVSGFLASNGGLTAQQGQANEVAEVMGGIDDRTGHVFQVRVSRDGNITTNHFPTEQLEHSITSLRIGRPYKK